MYSGGRTLADFWETWKTRVFRFSEKSEKVGPTSRPGFGAFQIAVSRARAVKNILAGPDGSEGPPEPSGPARILLTARARETAIRNGAKRCHEVGHTFSDLSQTLKTRVFQFSQKSAQVLPPLYMRTANFKYATVFRARETRNKTHHARAGGATGGPWCVLLRVHQRADSE